MTAGATPTRTSVNPNLASSTAMEMSMAAARPMPPATQWPAMRPTYGLGDRAKRPNRSRPATAAGGRRRRRPTRRALRQVGPGAEHAAPVGEHDDPDLGVGVGGVERVAQLADEPGAQGVAVGLVGQRDGEHAAVARSVSTTAITRLLGAGPSVGGPANACAFSSQSRASVAR